MEHDHPRLPLTFRLRIILSALFDNASAYPRNTSASASASAFSASAFITSAFNAFALYTSAQQCIKRPSALNASA